MLDLEKLGLVELNAQEVKEVEGGWFDWFVNWGSPSPYIAVEIGLDASYYMA